MYYEKASNPQFDIQRPIVFSVPGYQTASGYSQWADIEGNEEPAGNNRIAPEGNKSTIW